MLIPFGTLSFQSNTMYTYKWKGYFLWPGSLAKISSSEYKRQWTCNFYSRATNTPCGQQYWSTELQQWYHLPCYIITCHLEELCVVGPSPEASVPECSKQDKPNKCMHNIFYSVVFKSVLLYKHNIYKIQKKINFTRYGQKSHHPLGFDPQTGIDSQWVVRFLHPSRPDLGPTQLPVKWDLGPCPREQSSRGMALTSHPHLLRLKEK